MIKYAYVFLLGKFPESYKACKIRIDKKMSLFALVKGMMKQAPPYELKCRSDRYFQSDEFNSSQKIIHLHIPKCAGTSFAQLAIINDRDNVFFLREGGFQESWYKDKSMIGGHRPINFYEASRNNNLFVSIIRDPVERVVSLFNYYKYVDINNFDLRIQQGFNPDDIMETIDKSGFMTQFVDNVQCRYLSAHNNFEDTKSIIKRNKMILATLENINQWSGIIADEAGWKNNKLPVLNKGISGIESHSFDDEILQYLESHNSEDLRLFQYVKEKSIIDTR